MSSSPSSNNSRSIGFRLSEYVNTATTAGSLKPSSSPLKPAPSGSASKKQAKGRLFVATILLTIVGFVGWTLWNEMGRFQAYGELSGTLVQISPAARGIIESVAVQEGDHVKEGQVIATIDVRDLKLERTRLQSDLHIALANLHVRQAEVESRNLQLHGEQIDRQLEYQRFKGDYLAKRAQLDDLARTYSNNEQLVRSNSVSESELIASKSAYLGMKAQVEALEQAANQIDPNLPLLRVESKAELIQGEQNRIVAIEKQMAEVDRLLDAAIVRAPVRGRIVKRRCNVGEFADPSSPILEILEAGSVMAILYMPQDSAKNLHPGDRIWLSVAPLSSRRVFSIDRSSPLLAAPPIAFQNKYRAHKNLVRFYAFPESTIHSNLNQDDSELANWIGAELALPRFGFRASNDDHKERLINTASSLDEVK